MEFTALVALLLWLLIVPLNLKNVKRLPWSEHRKWLLCEAILGTSILGMFLAAWMGVLVARDLLGPQLLNVHWENFSPDNPVTLRSLSFLLLMIAMPYLIIEKVGLFSIRDIHQICKEQRDQMFRKPRQK